MQGHDNGPSAFGDSFTYISITTSPFFEILDQGSRWLINLLVIVILSKDEKIMGELLTFIYRWSQDVSWEEYVSILIRLQVIQPRGSFRDALILFAYLSIDLWWYDVNVTTTNIFFQISQIFRTTTLIFWPSDWLCQMGSRVHTSPCRWKCTGDPISVWEGRR